MEGEYPEGWGVSHWVVSQAPLPHRSPAPGGLVSGAAQQAERPEADPSWRKETGCPPGPQWTDWTTRMECGRISHGFIWLNSLKNKN